MHLIKKGLLFFIHSQLLISCCAVAFLFTGTRLLAAPAPGIEHAVLIFSATFLTYNLTAFLAGVSRLSQQDPSLKKGREKGFLNFLILLNLLLLVWSFPYHSVMHSLFLLHLGLISLLYNIPDRFAKTRFRSIRSIPLIKIFLIAYVWASIGAFYPVLEQHNPITKASAMLFFLFFVFIVAITLPFDIRDFHFDKKRRLLTVPGVIGIRRTKTLAIFLLIIYGIGLGFLFGQFMAALVLSIAGIILAFFASEEQPDWYYTALMDSLLILQLFLLN